MSGWGWLTGARRASYRSGRVLGDVGAILRPRRIPRRLANKMIGRRIVRRLWR